MNQIIKELVDEYSRWDNLAQQAKQEIEKIKARIQEIALQDLQNTKAQTMRDFGSTNNIATITTSETVKMVSYTLLCSVLGQVIGDFVKVEPSYKMSDPFKKIVAPICLGNYIEQKLDDVIVHMNVDEKTAKVLRKKLKGDAQKDAKVLASVGMQPHEAEHWVYFIAEAVAYEKLVKMLEMTGYSEGTPDFTSAINGLKLALIVEEGLKIGIEYEDRETIS